MVTGFFLEQSMKDDRSSEVRYDPGFPYESAEHCPGAVRSADELQFNLQKQQRAWT